MVDEYIAFDPATHVHEYEDTPEFSLAAYSLEEIFAEKLRALFQRTEARDYYDVYRMISETDVDDSDLFSAFIEKCDHDSLKIDLKEGLPAESRTEIRDGWQNTLPDLVADLPDFEIVYETLEEYVETLPQ